LTTVGVLTNGWNPISLELIIINWEAIVGGDTNNGAKKKILQQDYFS